MSKGHAKVLVVLSGGQDSTTALFWARSQFQEVHAITFNYGQRHAIELESARKVAEMAGVASHEFIDLGADVLKGTSPLVDRSRSVEQYVSTDALPGGVENTFVPGRNLLFLVIAANRAAVLGIDSIVIGVCQEDYGGYPDCRQRFITAMQKALGEGITGSPHSFLIHTPLMDLSKKQIVQLAHVTDGAWNALAYTHTCYNGQYPPDPFNHASLLRAKGFHEAGLNDPLIERAISEGLLPTDYPHDGLVQGTKYARVTQKDYEDSKQAEDTEGSEVSGAGDQ